MDRYQKQATTGAAGTLVRTRVQRVQRVLAFSAELARAMRREFDTEGLAPPATPGAARATGSLTAPNPSRELTAPFLEKLDALLELVREGERTLQKAQGLPEPEALRVLAEYDGSLNVVIGVGRGLEADAAALRKQLAELAEAQPARPAPRARATGPLADAVPAAAGFMGMLRKLAAPTKILEQPPQAPPAPAIPPEVARARQAFDHALKFVKDVLTYVSPRLTLVDVALALTGLPGRPKPWEQVVASAPQAITRAQISPADRNWVPALAKLFLADMDATRKAHGAVVQWQEARRQCDDAEMLAAALGTAAPERVGPLMSQFDLAKFNASIHPLKHLHLTFRGVQHLSAIFPPPAPSA